MYCSSALVLGFSVLASALNIISPKTGSTLYTKSSNHITWNFTAADPARLNIFLSGNAAASSVTLATNISKSLGKYTVPANTVNESGANFTITFDSIGSEGNSFLAEVAALEVVKGTMGAGSSTSSAAPSATSTGSAVRRLLSDNTRNHFAGGLLVWLMAVLV